MDNLEHTHPRVWLVMGYRAGENAQIRALGEALSAKLSWPFETKTIKHRRGAVMTGLLRQSGLGGINTHKSSALAPPWPDLVISAGMRNEPVCRWIQQQSGNKTRIIHIGRSWASPERFDLVVTTPQYRVPEHPNVLQNTLTLHGVTRERLSNAATEWARSIEHLPKPYTGLFMGGNSGHYTLGAKAAKRLGKQANHLVARTGGSLLVSTSSRTSKTALAILKAELDVPFHLYQWKADDTSNPYFGILALAESLIVTGDSVAMLSEVCATGKPLYIFDSGDGPVSMQSLAQDERVPLRSIPWRQANMDYRMSAFLYWQLMRWAPHRLSRDLGLVHRQLIGSGRAIWLGGKFSTNESPFLLDDVDRTVQRIRIMFPA